MHDVLVGLPDALCSGFKSFRNLNCWLHLLALINKYLVFFQAQLGSQSHRNNFYLLLDNMTRLRTIEVV